MPKAIINTPEILDRHIRHFMIDNDIKTKERAILKIIELYFKNHKKTETRK